MIRFDRLGTFAKAFSIEDLYSSPSETRYQSTHFPNHKQYRKIYPCRLCSSYGGWHFNMIGQEKDFHLLPRQHEWNVSAPIKTSFQIHALGYRNENELTKATWVDLHVASKPNTEQKKSQLNVSFMWSLKIWKILLQIRTYIHKWIMYKKISVWEKRTKLGRVLHLVGMEADEVRKGWPQGLTLLKCFTSQAGCWIQGHLLYVCLYFFVYVKSYLIYCF